MTISQIIQLWMKHTDYDPDRKSFYLGSMISEAHTCTKLMSELSNEYDNSGMLAVLYAKSCYEDMLHGFRINLEEFVKDKTVIQEYWNMWDAFNSPVVKEAEDHLIQIFNALVAKVSGCKLLGAGNREEDLQLLYSSVSKVTESLCKCKVESFLKGAPCLGELNHVSGIIEVFPTLAQCLRTVECRVDGVYIAYISQYNSAGGYFTFILKSNGNIISINDRIDETYIGQHGNSRNGRWTEKALFDLFPYDEILKFSSYDYKGYATKWDVKEIEDAGFPLKNLTQESYMAVLLAIILIVKKYAGRDITDITRKFVDTLLTPNLNLLEAHVDTTALVPVTNSAIVAYTNEWKPTIDTATVMNPDSGKRFDYATNKDSGKSYEEMGCFKGFNQEFVDLYGDDFILDPSKVFYTPDRLAITDGGETTMRCAEFVGTREKFDLEVFRQSRKQLADHINKRMVEEYEAFGGHEAVMKWFYGLVISNKEKLTQLALDEWTAIMVDKTKHNYESSPGWIPCSRELHTSIRETGEFYGIIGRMVNEPQDHKTHHRWDCEWSEHWKCPVTGTTANVWFTFLPCSYTEIERIFGVEVPKVMKGYTITSSVDGFAKGNSILDSTDAVADVDHIYSSRSKAASMCKDRPNSRFEFSIGFSKRGLNRLLKERQNNS